MRVRAAATWARRLGSVFERVALFEICGTSAKVVFVKGLDLTAREREVSLTANTPLRWTIEAASPVVGSGRAPGAKRIAEILGVDIPRAFAVLPLVIGGRLQALAYADNGNRPLPLVAVSRVFEVCDAAVHEDLSKSERVANPVERNERSSRGLDFITSTANKRKRFSLRGIDGDDYRRRLAAEEVTEELAEGKSFALELPANNVIPFVPIPKVRALVASNVRQRSSVTNRTLNGWSRIATAACLAVGLSGLGMLGASPPKRMTQHATLEIEQGTTVSQIAHQLQTGGIVRSAFMFQLMARAQGVDRAIRAGYYSLSPGMWLWDVVRTLHVGQVAKELITIPEGLKLVEIANLFEEKGLATVEGFLEAARDPRLIQKYHLPGTSVEGFVFPETYVFARGLAPFNMVDTMVELFFDRLNRIYPIDSLSTAELLRKVSLASIVEKEARRPDEKARVAGVFYNRMKRNMKLESCATVQYVLDKPKEKLRLADLRISSPYNTYRNRGLPPGPISSPGSEALSAVFQPEEHDYLFFVAIKDGSHRHVFTESYSEHKRAIKRLRKEGRF